MAKESKNTIIIATISAVSAIIVAVITTFSTIAVSEPKAIKLKRELEQKKIANLPIGTIVPSMLQPTDFAREVGDLDRPKSDWVLADGKTDITKSLYGQLSDKTTPPDLRGMFLRGMNVEGIGADPNKTREVGIPQSDMFKAHKHTIGQMWSDQGGKQYRFVWEVGKAPLNNFTTHDEGGVETRPKNVAVYFYIKIN